MVLASVHQKLLPLNTETSPSPPKMPLLRLRHALLLSCVAIVYVYAERYSTSIASMSMPEIEEKLQVCN
jgi:hypothetical protein